MPAINKHLLRAIAFFLVSCILNTAAASPFLQVSPKIESYWLWNLMGRLHPIAVHFPVSLVLLAAILELFTLKHFHSKLRPGINILVWSGGIAAMVAALLGWLLSGEGDYGEDGILIHQWSGFAAAFLSAIVLCMLYRVQKTSNVKSVKVYRGMLFFTAISISIAGHFGASVTHGNDYLTAGMPWSEDYQGSSINNIDFVALKNDTVKLTPKQEYDLNVQVKTIFAHNCNKCHGGGKSERRIAIG